MATTSMLDVPQRRALFASKVLGPVFKVFFDGLNDRLEAVRASRPDTIVLYQARAGVRLLELNQAYRQGVGTLPPLPEAIVYISRLSAIKGCLYEKPGLAAQMLVSEYAHLTIGDLLIGLGLDASDTRYDNIRNSIVQYDSFMELYMDREKGRELRELFCAQSGYFREYLQSLVGENGKVVLVDSGWYGSTQQLLMEQFPELEWEGLYYGKWRYRRQRPNHFDSMRGLCVDDDQHGVRSLRQLTLVYYHLIEGILEPDIPSVTGYRLDQNEVVVPVFDASYQPSSGVDDGMYEGVLRHLKEKQPARQVGLASRLSKSLCFWKLAVYILLPSRDDVDAMTFPPRSSDMGKSGSASVIYPPATHPAMSAMQRINASLWKPGQISLEFPRILSLPLQLAFCIKRFVGA